jgi:16S rRNA (adenine1518-N6/adenine1519-N6)-dimethyltransferase
MSSNSGITLTHIKNLQEIFGLRASKALGQNYLIDFNTSQKIAQLINAGENILEIGPGIGSLTIALARRAQKVFAIEYDKHLLEPLAYVLEDFDVEGQVIVDHDDVMKVDIDAYCRERNITTIVGNLPYNISATLLVDIAQKAPFVSYVVAMVQKEVGERLSAEQKSRDVSAATLKCQLFMDVEQKFDVSRTVFSPPPRVDSVVIEMKRHHRYDDVTDIGGLFQLIDAAFNQRRKMLRQSLKSYLGDGIDEIDLTLRPEQCSLDDFIRLYDAIHQRG